jgi:hypothetical protein
MIIEGGTGNGYKAKVDLHNRLYVKATSDSGFHHASTYHGKAYSWTAVTADINAGDTAILLCNDDPDEVLIIDWIYVWCDVATQLKIHVPAYGAWSGTAVTGVNLNRTSANIALATCKADEITNAFAAANTILTVHTNELTSDQYSASIDFKNAMVLGYHDSIAVDIVEESAAFEATIFGYFSDVG